MQIWQSVKAINGHQRAGTETSGGQAGIVVGVDNIAGGEVDVKWDLDGEIETVLVGQLQALN